MGGFIKLHYFAIRMITDSCGLTFNLLVLKNWIFHRKLSSSYGYALKRKCRHFDWLHWKLSFWQLSVQPVMEVSPKWQHHRFIAGAVATGVARPSPVVILNKLNPWQLCHLRGSISDVWDIPVVTNDRKRKSLSIFPALNSVWHRLKHPIIVFIIERFKTIWYLRSNHCSPGRSLLAEFKGALLDYVCLEWVIKAHAFSIGRISNITFIISAVTWKQISNYIPYIFYSLALQEMEMIVGNIYFRLCFSGEVNFEKKTPDGAH